MEILNDDDENDIEEVKSILNLVNVVDALVDGTRRPEKIQRRSCLFRKRWDYEYLRNLAMTENSFTMEYRVDPVGFDMLLELIRDQLCNDIKMCGVRIAGTKCDVISADSKLGCALIMLSGGRVTEVMRTHGVSKPFAYENLHRVVDAINACPQLKIEYDKRKLETYAKGFEDRSFNNLFKYCCGAIDGLAIRICIRKRDTANQTRFYSGSKKFKCLNLQGVCDANCLFTAFTCKNVGSTNDCDAFETCSLKQLNESLPFPFHWNADAAYTCTESAGNNLFVTDPDKDYFNFFHSQIRITIERCFGIFITRWGIFWKPLKFSLHRVFAIIHCCVRLHNFCTSRNLPIFAANNNNT